MAVEKMKLISIIGKMTELDAVVEICGQANAFQPDNALSFFSDTRGFALINETNPYSGALQRMKDTASLAEKPLRIVKDKGYSLSEDETFAYVDQLVSAVGQLQNRRLETIQAIDADKRAIEQIQHFLGLDINLEEVFSCKYIKVRFGRLPKDSYDKLNTYTNNPYVLFFPSSSDSQSYWGVYFSPIEKVSEVDRIFSSLYFERLRLPDFIGTPEEAEEQFERTLSEHEATLLQLDDQMKTLWSGEEASIMRVFTYLKKHATYFDLRRYIAKYNDNFIVAGWIPARSEKKFSKPLEKLETVEFSTEPADLEQKHAPPVKLKNSRLFRPFEFYVDMYGLPSYDEMDPTVFVGITYILLFGIMFGDLGQGLCLSLVGYFMWKLKNMMLGRILIRCGISSAFFGVLYGSVFGAEHLLDPLYRLLPIPFLPLHALESSNNIMTILLTAVGIGIFLVLISIFINILCALRKKHWESALFGPNGVAGFLFYGGLISYVVLSLGLGIQVPGSVILFLLFPLLCIFFREPLGALCEGKKHWRPEKLGEFCMQNFFELFEFLLSYVTNTMSFLRVGAFVLVHSGMMLMVTSLSGESFGLSFLLVQIFGNILVMCMEALLVGIQVLRLEFYEMFSRFFEGAGRPFKPVNAEND